MTPRASAFCARSAAGRRSFFKDMAFTTLKLSPPILQALGDEGYQTPTPIQAKAIPPILEGRDLLGCAQTGTGKTAAFALPIIHRLHDAPKDKTRRGVHPPRALILSPTRELVVQIAESFQTYGRHSGLTGTTIFGGVSQVHQVRALQRGVDIVVATPGRLIDLMEQRVIDLTHISVLVLDEADRMLDMGFIQPIRRIAGVLPKERQTLLFSATMPKEIVHLAEALLKNPVRVSVSPVSSAAPLIEQKLYMIPMKLKQSLLHSLLEDGGMKRVVVFTKTKHGADRVCRKLHHAGISAVAIHGNKAQNYRLRALDSFKSGKTRVLVATDVAARGLDVDGITHVVNFDLPMEPEAYVHRIGRTGRAGATGIAISFCDGQEHDLLRQIQRMTGKSIPQVDAPRGLQPIATSEHHQEDAPSYREPRTYSRGHERARPAPASRSEYGASSERPARAESGERYSAGAASTASGPSGSGTSHRDQRRPVTERFGARDGAGDQASGFRPSRPTDAIPHATGASNKRPHRKGPSRTQVPGAQSGVESHRIGQGVSRPSHRTGGSPKGAPAASGPRAGAKPQTNRGHGAPAGPSRKKQGGPRREHRS